MSTPVLEVDRLSLSFRSGKGRTKVLNEVSFTIDAGEIVGLVGESGSGKSVTALAISKLLPPETTFVESGEIRFEGRNVLNMSERDMAALRGKRIGFVFQEPMTALNPTMTVGDQLYHVIRRHHRCNKEEARRRVLRALEEVRIQHPDLVSRQYPFELSGGMRQRIVIALAMSANPTLLIADEPTTALDVTVQAEILGLIKRLAKSHGTAVLLITHDLGVVAQTCSRMVVMYAGEVVERGRVENVLGHPKHPYTKALLQAVPDIADRSRSLQSIEGELPDLRRRPPGCIFAPRCALRVDRCADRPPLRSFGEHQEAACWV
ncbi:MAG: ABC transporter ATP-binding protein, partial [Alicyclobacillaceae bacterium]|nr:ABC transporter ATP-binding protein [Alicyclobacillaceae bacterium]